MTIYSKHLILKLFYNVRLFRIIIYKYIKFKNYKNCLDLKLNENSIVLDFGANVGNITQCIKDLYNSNIYCYEPNKYAFKELENRFKNNNKITLINKAVGKKNSFGKLFYHILSAENPIKYSASSSLLKEKSNVNKNNFQITEIVSIKDIIKKFEYIDLIKIDIEGEEYNLLPEVFKNKKKIGKVVCELHGSSERKNKFLNKKYLKVIKLLNKLDPKKNWFKFHH